MNTSSNRPSHKPSRSGAFFFLKRTLRCIDKFSPPQTVHAHCDIPCGVYETDSMKWAALTCMKLVEKVLALEAPATSNKGEFLEYQNTVARAIHEKEEYAGVCKEQLLILWTDYFKAEHLTKYPDLHDNIWKATKQCSVVKRTVSVEEVKKLQAMVDKIAAIFAQSKS